MNKSDYKYEHTPETKTTQELEELYHHIDEELHHSEITNYDPLFSPILESIKMKLFWAYPKKLEVNKLWISLEEVTTNGYINRPENITTQSLSAIPNTDISANRYQVRNYLFSNNEAEKRELTVTTTKLFNIGCDVTKCEQSFIDVIKKSLDSSASSLSSLNLDRYNVTLSPEQHQYTLRINNEYITIISTHIAVQIHDPLSNKTMTFNINDLWKKLPNETIIRATKSKDTTTNEEKQIWTEWKHSVKQYLEHIATNITNYIKDTTEETEEKLTKYQTVTLGIEMNKPSTPDIAKIMEASKLLNYLNAQNPNIISIRNSTERLIDGTKKSTTLTVADTHDISADEKLQFWLSDVDRLTIISYPLTPKHLTNPTTISTIQGVAITLYYIQTTKGWPKRFTRVAWELLHIPYPDRSLPWHLAQELAQFEQEYNFATLQNNANQYLLGLLGPELKDSTYTNHKPASSYKTLEGWKLYNKRDKQGYTDSKLGQIQVEKLETRMILSSIRWSNGSAMVSRAISMCGLPKNVNHISYTITTSSWPQIIHFIENEWAYYYIDNKKMIPRNGTPPFIEQVDSHINKIIAYHEAVVKEREDENKKKCLSDFVIPINAKTFNPTATETTLLKIADKNNNLLYVAQSVSKRSPKDRLTSSTWTISTAEGWLNDLSLLLKKSLSDKIDELLWNKQKEGFTTKTHEYDITYSYDPLIYQAKISYLKGSTLSDYKIRKDGVKVTIISPQFPWWYIINDITKDTFMYDRKNHPLMSDHTFLNEILDSFIITRHRMRYVAHKQQVGTTIKN
jgi:hypothetical protein